MLTLKKERAAKQTKEEENKGKNLNKNNIFFILFYLWLAPT